MQLVHLQVRIMIPLAPSGMVAVLLLKSAYYTTSIYICVISDEYIFIFCTLYNVAFKTYHLHSMANLRFDHLYTSLQINEFANRERAVKVFVIFDRWL